MQFFDFLLGFFKSFTYVEPGRIQGGLDYLHITDSYATLTGSGTILAREFVFNSVPYLNRGFTILLKGGYNPAYSVNNGYSTIPGPLTVGKDALTVEMVIIK